MFGSSSQSCEWEVVNDDGFVYKRKKRRIDPTSSIAASDTTDPDPAIELNERRRRKRHVLVQLRKKYQTEISHWDNLSNTLKAMQLEVSEDEERDQPNPKLLKSGNKRFQSKPLSGSLVDELLLQVNEQEAVIRSFEKLCDVADSLCNAQEEMTNQQFFNLPIWNSPQELMASLCEN